MAAGSINERIAARAALTPKMAEMDIGGVRHVEPIPPGKSMQETLERIRSDHEMRIKQARAFKEERDSKPDTRVAVEVVERVLERKAVKRKGWPKGKPRAIRPQPQAQEIA